jgi:hypothetical protein
MKHSSPQRILSALLGCFFVFGSFSYALAAFKPDQTTKTANDPLTVGDWNDILTASWQFDDISNTGDVFRMNGNVGIGTDNPSQKLEVNGNILVNGHILANQLTAAGVSVSSNSPTGSLNVKDTGNIEMIGSTDVRLTLGSEGVENGVNNESNWIRADEAQLRFNSALDGYLFENRGNQVMTIDATGNVGIGPADPLEKLTVTNGNIGIRNKGGNESMFNTIGFGSVKFRAPDNVNHSVILSMEGGYDATGGGSLHFATGNDGSPETRMTITKKGNVGIGTDIPQGALDVKGGISLFESVIVVNSNNSTGGGIQISDDGGFYDNNDGYVRFDDRHGGEDGKGLVIKGEIQADVFIYTSDRKLKKNITTIENALEKVEKLRGVDFVWKKNEKKDIGFIAQEVEKILPELVSEMPNEIKAVQYGNIIPLLVEAIKEQQKEIDELKSLVYGK